MSTPSVPRDFGRPDVRNGYLPPRYRVHERPADGTWAAVPPVAMLTDVQGEDPCPFDVELKLAHAGGRLFVHAAVPETTPAVRDVPADDPHFWMQDHIEFRLLLDDGAQAQWILSPDGRVFAGPAAVAAACEARGGERDGGWTVELEVDTAGLALADVGAGAVLRGQLAYTRWHSDALQFWCFSSTELGYNQEERFGEFVLAGPVTDGPALRQVTCGDALVCGDNAVRVGVDNAVGREVCVRTEHDGSTGEQRVPVAADGTAAVTLALARPRFTRMTVAVDDVDLGAVCLRAGVPVYDGDVPPHPRLQEGVAAAEHPLPEDELQALRDETFPDASTPEAFLFHLETDTRKTSEAGWFRVCRESLVRKGAGGARREHAYIWGLLGADAQRAAREVSDNVALGDAQRPALKEAFNRLVLMDDFYREDVFADTALAPLGRRLIQKQQTTGLTPAEQAKLNRLLLQSSIECMRCYGAQILAHALELVQRWREQPSAALLAEITRRLRAFRDLYLPEEHSHLHEGGQAKKLAFAWDAVCEHLDAAARGVWLDVVDVFLEQFIHSSRLHAWTVTCVPNANAVSNSGLGTLALATLGEAPLAAEALRWARKHISVYFDYCSGAAGGNTEGTLYQNYGMGSSRPFLCALERVIGTDDGYFDHPAWRNYMNMVKVSLTNDGGMHGVNDTTPAPYSGRTAWFLGQRYDDPLAIWYGDHFVRMVEANNKRDAHRLPIDKLTAADRPAGLRAVETQPPLPTCLVLDDIQYSIMRSGPAWDCNLVAGLKGTRPPHTHHNQNDAGSIWVHVRGERLLIDPGYHKGAAGDHCLPLIDGRGPVRDGFVAKLFACDQGEHWRYLAVDTTPAYQGAAARARRHLLMLGAHTLLLLDDIVADADVCVQLQAGGPTTAAGDGAVDIAGRSTGLHCAWLDGQGTLELQDERTLKDTHFGYNFAACRMFPVHYLYRPASATPAVCVIQQHDHCRPAAVDHTDDGLTIAVDGVGDVVFHRDGVWQLARVSP